MTLKAWNDPDFCAEKLGRDEPLGEIDPREDQRQRLLARRRAIRSARPAGGSSRRWRSCSTRRGSGRGLISICAAGGQGVCAILEKETAVTDRYQTI